MPNVKHAETRRSSKKTIFWMYGLIPVSAMQRYWNSVRTLNGLQISIWKAATSTEDGFTAHF